MTVRDLSLPDLRLIEPRRFGDARGYFAETWNRRTLEAAGIATEWVQDNESMSVAAGTVRGMHYQAPPHAQAKLVRCAAGRIWDVVVDVRRGSPAYGRWEGVELSAANGLQLFVPVGFLHGFVTLEPDTVVSYKCSAHYAPDCDGSVLWSSCGIDWPWTGDTVLSDRDRAAPPLAAFESPFTWEGTA